MMSTDYLCNLGNGQQIYLENQGKETRITLSSSSHGQQQSQRMQFSTGAWQAQPTLMRTNQGWIVQIPTDQGDRYIQVQSQGMHMVTHPSSEAIESLPLQPVSSESVLSGVLPLQPMQPMEPMQMGNMAMKSQPMQMRMGNMEMSIGKAESAEPKFCSQCGNALEKGDRFCSQCGHRIAANG